LKFTELQGDLVMLSYRETLLCSYHYDPLDRLVATTPLAQGSIQRYYLKDRLSTEVQGAVQCSIMQHEDQLLAQQQRQIGAVDTRLLVTDQQRSVLSVLGVTQPHPLAYTPYGHRIPQNGLFSLLGFNGERRDPVTGCYLLGNGYRAFNPVLMRFNSPDSWSPFGEGGLNAYEYCGGNPTNQSDPTGHTPFRLLSNTTNTLSKLSRKSISIAKRAHRTSTNYASNSSRMRNIKPLRDNIFGFTDYHLGKKRLNVMGHGVEMSNGNYEIASKDGNLTPLDLAKFLNNEKKEHQYIRLVVCNSATGENSMAAQTAIATGIPTKGYVGRVTGRPSPEYLQYLIKSQNSAIRLETNGTYTYNKSMKIFENNPFTPDNPQYRLHEYMSVTKHPGGWQFL
jgi:RHS repeat-associated protein